MKTGYSIILGEYIKAEDVEYRDCEPFQIVCPACYEPLFKVQRQKDEAVINYLSHYSADRAYAEDCELRVDSQPRSAYENLNRTTHDQRLQYFLSILQKMIARHEMYPQGTEKSQKYLNRSKALHWFCDRIYENARKEMRNETALAEVADGYLRDMREVGVELKTTFAMEVQKRIAIDIWKYLLSNKGEPNFRFLFNHAYLMDMIRLNAPMSNETPDALAYMQKMLGYIAKIPETNREKGMMIFAEMGNTPLNPPFTVFASNYFNKASADIAHEMIGSLLGLPYFEFLKERVMQNTSQHNMHEGLTKRWS